MCLSAWARTQARVHAHWHGQRRTHTGAAFVGLLELVGWGEGKTGLLASTNRALPLKRHLGGGDVFTAERLGTALRVLWRARREHPTRITCVGFERARHKYGRMAWYVNVKSGDILRKTLPGVKNVNVFC